MSVHIRLMDNLGLPAFDIDHHRRIASRFAAGPVHPDLVAASNRELLAEVEQLRATAGHQTILASTFGPLVTALESCDPAATVLLDFGGELANPGATSYYRGYHGDLAISHDGPGPVTVAELLTVLYGVRGSGFTAPGAKHLVFDSTEVWVANRREPSGQHIVGLRVGDGKVAVLTEERG